VRTRPGTCSPNCAAGRCSTASGDGHRPTSTLWWSSLGTERAAAFAAEAAAQEVNMTTQDAREGLTAFVERRSPEFRGR
jgi:2-(1,2-epoxy-1,2-dihydrophenyl)acetyl-CoA isomerase